MTYFDHNDAKGLARRLTVAASKQERAHAEALAEERRLDPWGITLYMSKYDLQGRLGAAAFVGPDARAMDAVEASYKAAEASAMAAFHIYDRTGTEERS